MPRSSSAPKETAVPLREAKANLSSLTKQAKGGARIVITNHGTPVADLVSHGMGKPSLAALKRPGPLPKPMKLKGKGPTASDLVLMDREG